MVVEDLALLKEQVRAAVSFRFNLFWGVDVVVFWWMARISVLGWILFGWGMEKADIL